MSNQSARQVYPRECGATIPKTPESMPVSGLSPRVRGNLLNPLSILFGVRSIPASAGQPLGMFGMQAYNRVYPRECGATVGSGGGGALDEGLSPRVRGNHYLV